MPRWQRQAGQAAQEPVATPEPQHDATGSSRNEDQQLTTMCLGVAVLPPGDRPLDPNRAISEEHFGGEGVYHCFQREVRVWNSWSGCMSWSRPLRCSSSQHGLSHQG